MPLPLGTGAPAGGDIALKGGRRRGVSVKTLKKMLKKAGLKTSGRKAALTRRAKKAHLKMRGGEVTEVMEGDVTKYKSSNTGATYNTQKEADEADASLATGGRSRRSRRRGIFGKLF